MGNLMFTGIIEETGRVETPGSKLRITCQKVLSDLTIGASIAVNGVCLTAVDIDETSFTADLAPETLERSSLGDLKPNDPVNLERPLTLNARLSGHIVQGHVDGTASLEDLKPLPEGNWELTIQIPPNLEKFLVYKGSIAIDGISLTIASIDKGHLKVAIIPHTYEATNLHIRKPGDRLNLECDILAKHVDKLLSNVDLARRPQPLTDQ